MCCSYCLVFLLLVCVLWEVPVFSIVSRVRAFVICAGGVYVLSFFVDYCELIVCTFRTPWGINLDVSKVLASIALHNAYFCTSSFDFYFHIADFSNVVNGFIFF